VTTTCDVCGTSESVSKSAEYASSLLTSLPEPARAWLESTYQRALPMTLCAECFIPALGGANSAAEMASKV
jgi:hypothetical protein